MSQYPRRLLAGTSVSWDPAANGMVNRRFFRAGTIADIMPGSALEAAYGAGALSGVIPAGQMGDGTSLSKEAISN